MFYNIAQNRQVNPFENLKGITFSSESFNEPLRKLRLHVHKTSLQKLKQLVSINILTVMVLGTILSSCSVSEKRISESEEMKQLSQKGEGEKFPTWNIVQKKTVFVFEDKDNLVIPLKQAMVDSIMIMRTTVIHSDSTKWGDTHLGDWVIPNYDDYNDTTYMVINGRDTVTYMIETLTFSASAFKLKRTQ